MPVQVSKAVAYAVISAPEARVAASKTNAYAVVSPPVGKVNVSKAVAYAVLAPPVIAPPDPPREVQSLLPAGFLSALQAPGCQALYWIEIEGLPYAYGNRAQASAFWSELPLAQRFEEIRPYLPSIPAGVDSRLDPLEGMASPGEFQFSVVDVDGFLTQAANVGREDADVDALYLTADVNPGATTISVGGNLASWPSSGTAYIGRTTLSYTGKGAGTLTGVTLGRYRSPDVLHTQGEPVTLYPVHLKTRRVWFYLALSTTGTWSVLDRVTRYAGALDDYNLDPSSKLTTWSLTVRTPEKGFADTTLFRELRAGRLKSSLPGIATGATYVSDVTTGATGAAWNYEKSDDSDPGVLTDANGNVVLEIERTDLGLTQGFAGGDVAYLRVEDEILKGTWDATTGRLNAIHRGLFGTGVVQHAYRTEWREGVPIIAQDATGIPEAKDSKFTMGDRPEELILQFLCGTGAYAVLPENWNAGFDQNRVDVASFETVRDQAHGAEHLVAWVDEPVSFADLVVEHLLKPWGLFLVHGSDDKVRLGYLRQGPSAATVATLDSTTITDPPAWKSGSGSTVGEYRLECDMDVLGGIGGDPGTIMADVFLDTRRLYGKEKTNAIVHRSMFAHVTGGVSDSVGAYRKAVRTFDSRRSFFAIQYGRPPPTITVKALFSLFPVQPGEWVTVNLASIPSTATSGRGYSGPGLVLSKKPVDREWRVEFDVLLLGGALDRYAFVAPAARVSSVAGTTATIIRNAFTAAPDTDASHFKVGDAVWFADVRLDQLLSAVVTGVNGDVLSFDSVPAAVGYNWLILPADYGTMTSDQKARKLAAFAGADETLSGGARACRYSGI